MAAFTKTNKKNTISVGQNLFNLLYDYAPYGYIVLSRDGEILEINFNAAYLLQNTPSGLNGKDFIKYISSDDKNHFQDFLDEIFRNHLRLGCEISLRTENTQREVRIEGAAYNKNNCLISLVEVTDRNLQMELKNTKIYQRIFETSRDGIIIINAENGKILHVNHSFTEITEFTREELMQKKISDLCSKGSFAIKELLDDIQKNNSLKHYILTNKSKRKIDIEIVCNNIYYIKGREIQCNIRDISARRKNERRLKKNETRLKELNAAKDKFFSIISHDLRSPFTCIIGFSDLLIEKAAKQDFKEIESYALQINTASWRAINLLTDLLDWSRAQIGRLKCNPQKIEVNQMIEELLQDHSGAALQKRITIETDVPQDLTICADKPMVKTILRNLISNAIKFTYSGGTIVISTYSLQCETFFSVSDNGIGMDEQKLKSLFKIEGSASASGTNNEVGTGLGLLICKEFVSKHGGEIWAESAQGNGSKFSFTLPSKSPEK